MSEVVASYGTGADVKHSADRHSASVGRSSIEDRPRPRLALAPFGWSTQRSALSASYRSLHGHAQNKRWQIARAP